MRIRGGAVAAAAVALAAALGFLLLGGEPREARSRAGGSARGKAGIETDSAASPRSAGGALGAAAGIESTAAEDGASGSTAAEGPVLEIRAVVPGGFPLEGAMILPYGRDADGDAVALFAEGSPEPGSTDGEGIFRIRYRAEPPIRLFGLHGKEGDLLEVKGGKAEEAAGAFLLVRADGEGPVTLTIRDPERGPLLRLLDGTTGAVIRNAGPAFLIWDWADGTDAAEEEPSDDLGESPPGWHAFELPEPGRAARPRILVAGYRPTPLPEDFTEGRRVVRLERDPGAIRGNLVLPGGPDGEWPLSWNLRRADPADARPIPTVAGTVVEGGPFVLSGLDAGNWVLEVNQVRTAAGARDEGWAVRSFRYEGKALDLGELRIEPGARIRARLFGPDGLPVEKGGLVLLDPGTIGRGLHYTRRMGAAVRIVAGEGLRVPEEGPEGAAEFRGLRPGSRWILAAPGVPGLQREVTAPAVPGETAAFEIGRGVLPVECRLRFTVGGREPDSWLALVAGPAVTDAFATAKGLLEAPIVAGRHRFTLLAILEPDGERVFASADVEIPDGLRYDATVDLEVDRQR